MGWLDASVASEAALRAHVREVHALDVELAWVLAWLRGQPLETLGYTSWESFRDERVDWAEAWVREMVRLVLSGLPRVVAAVAAGEVPVGLAVQAPGWCKPEDQEAWLAKARAGKLPPRPKKTRVARIELGEEDAKIVWLARHEARLLSGLRLQDWEADAWILDAWRHRRHDLVERALAPAPKPERARLDWDDAPASLEEGLARLEVIQEARRTRALDLGAAYAHVVKKRLHRAWGYPNVEAFCVEVFGCSARTMQRYRELGEAVRRFPPLVELPLTKATAVARVARSWDVERWVAVAKRVGVTELQAAVAHVEAGALLLEAYEEAMAKTTTTVALDSVKRRVPPPLTDKVFPELLTAAIWLLSLKIPPQRGFGVVKERDDFVCSNPECRRRALRNHAHHRDWRSHGGGNEPDNGECQCGSCHLRLTHAGHVRQEKVGEAWVWHYPGRVVTVFPGPRIEYPEYLLRVSIRRGSRGRRSRTRRAGTP